MKHCVVTSLVGNLGLFLLGLLILLYKHLLNGGIVVRGSFVASLALTSVLVALKLSVRHHLLARSLTLKIKAVKDLKHVLIIFIKLINFPANCALV